MTQVAVALGVSVRVPLAVYSCVPCVCLSRNVVRLLQGEAEQRVHVINGPLLHVVIRGTRFGSREDSVPLTSTSGLSGCPRCSLCSSGSGFCSSLLLPRSIVLVRQSGGGGVTCACAQW